MATKSMCEAVVEGMGIDHMVGRDERTGTQKQWNFTHKHEHHHGALQVSASKVMGRLNKMRPRLPSVMYDVEG